jgi:hypothetical protein
MDDVSNANHCLPVEAAMRRLLAGRKCAIRLPSWAHVPGNPQKQGLGRARPQGIAPWRGTGAPSPGIATARRRKNGPFSYHVSQTQPGFDPCAADCMYSHARGNQHPVSDPRRIHGLERNLRPVSTPYRRPGTRRMHPGRALRPTCRNSSLPNSRPQICAKTHTRIGHSQPGAARCGSGRPGHMSR